MRVASNQKQGSDSGTGPDSPSTAGLRAISVIFRLLAISFAVVGMLFLLFPDGTVRVINAAGALFRIFPPAPPSALRFWLSLGVSYMALVTVMAVLIQRDPRRYRDLMPVLAVGKFCSSFTCLLFFLFSSPTFLYLLNFLVDGSITLLVLGCYAAMGLVEAPSRGEQWAGASAPILDAMLDTLMPATGGFAIGARQTPVAHDLWQYSRQLHALGPFGLAVLLRGLEFGPYLFGPRPTRFTHLSAEDRERYLRGFERSRFAVRRQVIANLKLIAMLHFYDYPDVQRAIGYDGMYLRDKLLAGPNAAQHRAHLK
jgi:hypothetical protein